MKKNENNKHMCAPDSKVKDQCSYKVWMEQQEDWREVEWKEKQLYNPCMLSQLLCSDASPAQSTVRNLPQILAYSRHLNVPDLLRYFRCFIFESIVQREPPDPSGSILVLCVCVPKLRSCCAATMSDSFGFFLFCFSHSPDCELEILLVWRICAQAPLPTSSDFYPFLHLDLIWTTPHCPSLLTCKTAAVCSQRSQRFLSCSWHRTFLSSLSLDPPAGALWVTGSQRKSVIVFGTLPPATVRWVRNRINSRNTNRIFTSFHQWGLTGFSCTITPTGCRLHSTVNT